MKNSRIPVVTFVVLAFLAISIRRRIVGSPVLVKEVVDGDTILLATGERVRLLGINSPENDQYYYNESVNELKSLIEGKDVILEKDIKEKDRYGRLLRYIFVNGIFVNLEMIKRGCAHVYIVEPNTRYSEQFLEAQKEAMEKQLGIWKKSPFSSCIRMIKFDYYKEFITFKNVCNYSISLDGWYVTDETDFHVYKFSETVMDPHSSLTLHTKRGEDNSTDIFWGSERPIWNNNRDTVFLRDGNGLLVLSYTYP